MSKEKRIELLRTISELEMPPYNNERYATDALLASMRLRRGEDEWPPTPTTPARRQTPRTSHSNTRSGASAASARIGRPRNPTTTVTVYIYAEVSPRRLPKLFVSLTRSIGRIPSSGDSRERHRSRRAGRIHIRPAFAERPPSTLR